MNGLKYTVIKNKTQYRKYCNTLERLVENRANNKSIAAEIDLLTLLIERWDAEHNRFMDMDPVKLIHSFMAEHNMKARDLVKLLKVSKGYVSDILHFKKGLSKEVIRGLSAFFKVSQEAFNRPYKLDTSHKLKSKNKRASTTRKSLVLQ